jgi:flagellar basal-body rod protein FlgB
MYGDMTMSVLGKGMQGLSRRLESTSKNIANANTPAYARRKVSFEEELREVINGPSKLPMIVTDRSHIPSGPLAVDDVVPTETRVSDEPYRLDGNAVDPEREMAVLTETRMSYTALSRFLARKGAMLRSVMGGQ